MILLLEYFNATKKKNSVSDLVYSSSILRRQTNPPLFLYFSKALVKVEPHLQNSLYLSE